jgi:signal transduction histidine kinase
MVSEEVGPGRDNIVARPSWWGDLGTWAKVSLTGIAVAALLAFALGVFITRQVETRFLEADIEATQEVLEFLTGSRAIGSDGSPNTELLTDFVEPGLDRGAFVRVKLWSPDGTILFSDESRLIGRSFELDEDLPTLFEPLSHIADLEADENVFERELAGSLLETYVPVVDDGTVVAVWEVYRPLDDFNAAVRSVRRTVLLTVSGGLLLLGVALVSAFGALIAAAQRRRHEAERRSVDLLHLLDLARSVALHHNADRLLVAAVEQLEERPGIESVHIVERRVGPRDTSEAEADAVVVTSEDGALQLRARLSTAEDSDLRPLLAAAVEEIRIGLQKAALYDDLEANRRQIESVMNLLVNAQEDERRRLVADIHDGLAQDLYRVLFGIRGCLTADSESVNAELHDLEALVADSSLRLRQLLQTIHPSIIEDLGLGSSLRTLSEQIQERYGLQVSCEVDDALQAPLDLSMAAYRVTQEALVNVGKHASATSAEVVAKLDGADLHVTVCDNGSGIAPGTADGLGMWLMRDRAERLGGEFAVETDNTGTRVSVRLPVGETTK